MWNIGVGHGLPKVGLPAALVQSPLMRDNNSGQLNDVAEFVLACDLDIVSGPSHASRAQLARALRSLPADAKRFKAKQLCESLNETDSTTACNLADILAKFAHGTDCADARDMIIAMQGLHNCAQHSGYGNNRLRIDYSRTVAQVLLITVAHIGCHELAQLPPSTNDKLWAVFRHMINRAYPESRLHGRRELCNLRRPRGRSHTYQKGFLDVGRTYETDLWSSLSASERDLSFSIRPVTSLSRPQGSGAYGGPQYQWFANVRAILPQFCYCDPTLSPTSTGPRLGDPILTATADINHSLVPGQCVTADTCMIALPDGMSEREPHMSNAHLRSGDIICVVESCGGAGFDDTSTLVLLRKVVPFSFPKTKGSEQDYWVLGFAVCDGDVMEGLSLDCQTYEVRLDAFMALALA